MTVPAADVQDIVIADAVGSGEDFFFTRCKDLIVHVLRNTFAKEILEAQVNACHTAFCNQAFGKFCQVAGNDIQTLTDSLGIFADEL